jgi:hypothetical protein
MLGVLAQIGSESGVDPRAIAQLWAAAEFESRARRAVDGELRCAAGLLESAGIAWMVLKGPVVAATYPDPQVRTYRDLDIVVERHRFGDAVALFEAAGYELVDRNWALMAREGIGQVHLVRPGGIGIDLHFHLLSNRSLRRHFALDMDEVFAGSRPVDLGGVTCQTPGPEHTLLHLCLHAALEGADRLVWLCDVRYVILAERLSWDRLVDCAQRWRVHLVAGTVLDRARRVVGAQVPDEVVRTLIPSVLWREVVGVANRRFAPEVGAVRGSVASILARSTRDSVARTLAEAGVGLLRRARRVVTTGETTRRDTRADPGSPTSLLYPAGGASERKAYFASVADGD